MGSHKPCPDGFPVTVPRPAPARSPTLTTSPDPGPFVKVPPRESRQSSLLLDSCCRAAANLGQREVWPKNIVLVDIDGASGAEMPAFNADVWMSGVTCASAGPA